MPDESCNKRLSQLEASNAETMMYRKMREESEHDSDIRRETLINEVRLDISQIKEYMSMQKSFVGAVIFIVGGMWAVISLFADRLIR